MQAIEAVNTSVWAMAHHPGGRQIAGMGYKNNLGFTVAIPFTELFIEFCQNDLMEALQILGLDDSEWEPEGPEGIYEEFEI